MNFYFCESCGKRVTEDEITQGKARDKKLKGVFCVSCSVGVNTMEMMPVSDAEIKAATDALAEDKPPISPPPLPARVRRTTSANTLSAESQDAPQKVSAPGN